MLIARRLSTDIAQIRGYRRETFSGLFINVGIGAGIWDGEQWMVSVCTTAVDIYTMAFCYDIWPIENFWDTTPFAF